MPHIAQYAMTSGLSGCYMPNSGPHLVTASTRKALADTIRAEIEAQGFPKCCFEQVKIRNLWRFISRNGSSVAHFTITHGSEEIAFHGLTEAEAAAFDVE
jgi:hypothetical protein